MNHDWLMGLLGGGLIGTSAAIFLLVNGKIMGASGLIGGLVDKSGMSNWQERAAWLVGLFAVPAIMTLIWGVKPTNITGNLAVIVAAGLFVGVGTRIANGCTSGHGICGISRLSLRGIVATVFYILAGGLTVVIFKHVLGVI
ncbi:MAG: YeeE/YedE thiosulfate transporter family protein [Yoonia sp.]|nr:YeeE/YedE thiosulfate transporter family protein [Yoonia sp.]MDG1861931.1 YeeE/YedE thiosulfate transporter family protein [Yoonia sp.]